MLQRNAAEEKFWRMGHAIELKRVFYDRNVNQSGNKYMLGPKNRGSLLIHFNPSFLLLSPERERMA